MMTLLEKTESFYQNRLTRIVSAFVCIAVSFYGLILFEPLSYLHLFIPLILCIAFSFVIFIFFFRTFRSVFKLMYLFTCLTILSFSLIVIGNGKLQPQEFNDYEFKAIRYYTEKYSGSRGTTTTYNVDLDASEIGKKVLKLTLNQSYYELFSKRNEPIKIRIMSGFFGIKWINKETLAQF